MKPVSGSTWSSVIESSIWPRVWWISSYACLGRTPIRPRHTTITTLVTGIKEITVESILLEIRAAEGGADAKLLVTDTLAIYRKAAVLHRL